jgi:protocatechuate 3,4-dioxygenase beta subunit
MRLIYTVPVLFVIVIVGYATIGSAKFAKQEEMTAGERGLPVAANAPSFMPSHITGPQRGSTACPLCTYGLVPQVQIWVEDDQLRAGIALAKEIDKALVAEKPSSEKSSAGYLIVSRSKEGKAASDEASLISAAQLREVFATAIPRWDDPETGGLYGHSIKDRPGIRVYLLVNRRVFKRWDQPKASERQEILQAMKDARSHMTNHEIADSQIAPSWVTGQRMEVLFQVVDARGKPMSGVKVGANQTGVNGLYNPIGWGRREPTLSALAWTDSAGKITFRTIFPGPYPTNKEPSHIHFTATLEGKPKWRTLWFEGDALLTPEKRLWAEHDQETEVVKIDKSGITWRVNHTFQIK